jgi:hypothetical protein
MVGATGIVRQMRVELWQVNPVGAHWESFAGESRPENTTGSLWPGFPALESCREYLF